MDNISLGIKLTDLRVQMGLTQKDIATKMNVREKIIIDIENGELHNAPIIFTKNYVRSYAKIVGLSCEEYEDCFDGLSQKMMSEQIKKYSATEKQNRKKWLIASVLGIFCILSLTTYYVWATNKNKNKFVEVVEYVSPSLNGHVNG